MSKFKTIDERNEWIKCAASFEYFCKKYLTVHDKQEGSYVPFNLFPFQKKLVDLYEDNTEILTNKYRQAGISTVTNAYFSWKICFFTNIKIAIVANKVKLAKKNLAEIAAFIKNLPDFLKPDSEGDSFTKEHKIWVVNNTNNEVQLQTASEEGIRGFSPNYLFIDEAAFLEYGEEFWNGSAAITSTGCKVILVSTPNGQDPLFYGRYELALEGRNSFAVNIIKWYNDPRYSEGLMWNKYKHESIIEDDPQKRVELEKLGWIPTSPWYEKQCEKYKHDKRVIAQELEGVFHGSGGTVIPDEDIKNHENKYVNKPIEIHSVYRNLLIWNKPVETNKYILSIDVATGQGSDYSTFIVWNINTGYIDVEFKDKIPPTELGLIAHDYALLYNEAYVIVDITGSYGVPTIISIMDKGYTNVHFSDITNKDFKRKLEKYQNNRGKTAGFLIGQNRNLIITDFKEAVATESVKICSERLIEELKNFVYAANGRPDHRRGYNDDIIIAVAMAIYVYNTDYLKQINEKDSIKKMVNNWVVVNQDNYEEFYTDTNNYTIDNSQTFLFF